jgi:protein phosphatase PTC7
MTLKNILVEAVKKNTNTGSSTACLASLGEDDMMKTTNLGDSGYVIFRFKGDGTLQKVFRSKEQQYSFNFPYQCGTGCDLPYNAYDNEHTVVKGDIVVMGTDGVFDNVFDEDMEPCILDHKTPLARADCIGEKAYGLSHDKNYESPFAKGAKEHRRWYMGGKTDDITVVVAEII